MTDDSLNIQSTDSSQAGATQADSAAQLTVSIRRMEQAIEAILFAAGYPVTYEKLSSVIGLSVYEVRSLVAHMSDAFEERGIQLLRFPDACQLCTREEFAPYIREALGIRRGGNLSASSMEVLAVVAYNQPVTRAYIDTIRGVDSSYAVSSLLDKGLIEVTGHLEAPGRPALLGTTEKFLRVFGLASLSDLPKTESLSVGVAGSDDSSDSNASSNSGRGGDSQTDGTPPENADGLSPKTVPDTQDPVSEGGGGSSRTV